MSKIKPLFKSKAACTRVRWLRKVCQLLFQYYTRVAIDVIYYYNMHAEKNNEATVTRFLVGSPASIYTADGSAEIKRASHTILL